MRTRGEGVKKFENFADIINGRPLTEMWNVSSSGISGEVIRYGGFKYCSLTRHRARSFEVTTQKFKKGSRAASSNMFLPSSFISIGV